MKIKSRLLLFIGAPLVVMLVLSFSILINNISHTLEKKLENQLSNQSVTISKQISDITTTAARSYLMAVGHESDLIIKQFHDLYKIGELDFETSKELILKALSDSSFLKSGYIFVTDDNGVIVYHPTSSKIGTTASTASWIKQQSMSSRVFYSYVYNNRPKLLFRTYNETYNINICSSAYTSDFLAAVDMDELVTSLNNTHIGEKGYPMILDPAGNMISHPDRTLIGTNVLNKVSSDGIKIFEKIIEEGSGHFNYLWEEDGTIEKKFMYFSTEVNTGFAICATGYIDDFYDTVDEVRIYSTVFGTLLVLVVGLVIFFVASSVSKPISRFTSGLEEVSEGDGDLTKSIKLKDKSEIGSMVLLFNTFISTLRSIISKIKDVAGETIEIKDCIAVGIEETSSALTEISANIDGIKLQTGHLESNVERTTDSIYRIDSSIEGLNSSIEEQSLMVESSTAAITEMISSIDNVSKITTVKQNSAKNLMNKAVKGSEIIDSTQTAVQSVNNQLINIKEMAQVISNIASQTNLLAMNAAIEAAHAGDAGKGFAVVADEIRKLAEDSSDNSSRITETLNSIEASIVEADSLSRETQDSFAEVHSEITEIVGALEEIDSSTSELELGGRDILNSMVKLEENSNTVKEKSLLIKDESKEVKDAMSSTQGITTEVVTAVEEISQGTRGISESMESLSLTSERLKDTGEKLVDSVDQFKT